MTRTAIETVVIGASAGAVQALLTILPAMPSDFPLPILIVVHVPADRNNALVPLFQSKCQLAVKEAEDKEAIVGGTVYFAPADYHLLIEDDRTLALSSDEPVNHSRPAIDVLLESAADAFGPALLGIILTGANHDGASGLRAIADAGGIAMIENPGEAEVPTMPAAALDACPKALTVRLDDIASTLVRLATA